MQQYVIFNVLKEYCISKEEEESYVILFMHDIAGEIGEFNEYSIRMADNSARSCGTVALMVLGQFSDANIRKLAKDHKGYGSAATRLADNSDRSKGLVGP